MNLTDFQIQLIVSVCSILFGGAVTAVISHTMTTGRAEKEFRRKKLEELFLAVQKYCILLHTANVPYLDAMQGKLTYSQVTELSMAQMAKHVDNDTVANSHDKARMLINIYFRHLTQYFGAIIATRDKLNSIREQFKNTDARGESGHPFINAFLNEMANLDALEKRLSDEIFKTSRKYD